MSEAINECCPPQMRNPGLKDPGPCRETAQSRLTYLVAAAERRLAGLKALQKVAEHAEPGSPLEEMLADMSFTLTR